MALNITKTEIEDIYKQMLPKLKSYLYRLTCDREISNDLAHDTFIRVIERMDQFKGDSNVNTWIFSIATNLAIDYQRKRKRWHETAQDEAKVLAQSDNKYREMFLAINKESPMGAFEIREHINFCFTCISKTLPLEHQVTLLLKDVYEFKINEIAVILEAAKGTVKHWLFEARKKMTAVFDRRCALVNKNGVCHQCSELNGFFNPRQKKQEAILKAKNNPGKTDLYAIRAELIKAIDPLNSGGSDLENAIMHVLRKAIKDN